MGLTALFLDSNNITDDGIGHLAHMFKFNQTLRGLALGINNISDSGVQKLIRTLIEYRIGITGLNIFANKAITDKSVDVFVEFFESNRNLKLCKLYDCNFSANGKDKLKRAAKFNRGLIL